MKICPQCQTENFDGNRLCKNCNNPFQVNLTVNYQAGQTAQNFGQSANLNPGQALPKKGISNSVGILIAVGIAIFASCGLCGLIGALNPRKDKVAVATPTPTQTETPATATTPVQPNKPQTPKPYQFNYETDGLELVSAKWEKGGFDTVAIWKVTIKNVSDKTLGDIKFKTVYYSETKNIVGKGGVDALLGKDTIQKSVPPKSTRTFEVNDGFISDEAQTANFELVSWRIIE